MDSRITKTISEYNRIAEGYTKENNSEEIVSSMAPLLDKFIEYIEEGKDILDVGCGHGRDSKYFSENEFNVTAVDLSEELLSIAKKISPKANFMLMDMRNLSFQDNSFDGLWACASFLHVPKEFAKGTLSGFYNALKPEGLLFLCVKEGEYEGFMKSNSYGGCERYFSNYTLDELENLLSSSGFEMIELVIDDKFINTYSRAKK